ncbi:MAG: alpha/beta hydrolase [Clostridiales bacterium]|nr:alpha/beta hydrolase [Clostridiales bacterium]
MPTALINGQHIHYEFAGVQEHKLRTPALLLHGNGESMKIWSHVVPPLASTRGFVLMDSRYQGESRPDDPAEHVKLSYPLMADDAIKLMEDELAIPEYDVIGFSDGAVTALYMSLKSIRVRRLILIGVNSDPSGLKPRTARMIRRELEDAIREKNRVKAALMRLMLEEPKLSLSDLAKIICETTVVIGQRDEAVKLRHAAAVSDAIPRGSFVVIKGAGHDVPQTRPEELTELIRSLL